MPIENLRVLIVGENPLARTGLAALLGVLPSLIVTGQVAADVTLQAALVAYLPDVIIWEMGWEPGRGLELLRDLHEELPPVLALVQDEGRAVDAFRAGARGVLPPDSSAESLSAGLQALGEGLVVLSPGLLAQSLPLVQEMSHAPEESLTPRELEVLTLVAEGLPNKRIAAELHISEHTVKFHINAVMTKLNAQSRTDAVVRATRLGLLIL